MAEGYDGKVKETGYHSDRLEQEEKIDLYDKSLKVILETRGFKIYMNPKTQEMYLQVVDYHAGTLVISKEGLEKMISDMERED